MKIITEWTLDDLIALAHQELAGQGFAPDSEIQPQIQVKNEWLTAYDRESTVIRIAVTKTQSANVAVASQPVKEITAPPKSGKAPSQKSVSELSPEEQGARRAKWRAAAQRRHDAGKEARKTALANRAQREVEMTVPVEVLSNGNGNGHSLPETLEETLEVVAATANPFEN
jgi:hypothetical protein